MAGTDLSYHVKREAAERALADSATCEEARRAHVAMADQHATLAAQASYEPRRVAGGRSA